MTDIEAISPSEAAIAVDPIRHSNMPHTKAVGPPFSSPAWKDTVTASHDDCNVTGNPIVGKNAMYLLWRVSKVSVLRSWCDWTHIKSLCRSNFSVTADGLLIRLVLVLGCVVLTFPAMAHFHIMIHCDDLQLGS